MKDCGISSRCRSTKRNLDFFIATFEFPYWNMVKFIQILTIFRLEHIIFQPFCIRSVFWQYFNCILVIVRPRLTVFYRISNVFWSYFYHFSTAHIDTVFWSHRYFTSTTFEPFSDHIQTILQFSFHLEMKHANLSLCASNVPLQRESVMLLNFKWWFLRLQLSTLYLTSPRYS